MWTGFSEFAPCRPSDPQDARWTRADLARLIDGDAAAWERALVMIEHVVETLAEQWALGTIDAEAVRDHVVDTLLADGGRRLHNIRDPCRFAGYLSTVARNRVRYAARRRIRVIPLSEVWGRMTAVSELRTRCGSLDADGIVRVLTRLRSALSEKQFRILWLYHVECQSMTRIAKAMRVTQQAVAKTHATAISVVRVACAGDTSNSRVVTINGAAFPPLSGTEDAAVFAVRAKRSKPVTNSAVPLDGPGSIYAADTRPSRARVVPPLCLQ